MADGAGGIGKAVTDSLKDIGKDLTVNLASDMFNQLSGKKPAGQASQGQNSQMAQVQKNAQIANITRRIQDMKQKRQQAAQQTKQQEQQRMQAFQYERQQKQQQAEAGGKGMGGKLKDLFSNWGNTLARRGKGEQRGNKMHG